MINVESKSFPLGSFLPLVGTLDRRFLLMLVVLCYCWVCSSGIDTATRLLGGLAPRIA